MADTEKFDCWAILELMGHRKLAGRITEATIAGGAFIRIDVPGEGSNVATQFYSPGSVYCMTPCTEELARRVAQQQQPQPVTEWELPKLPATAPARDADFEDPEDEEEASV